MKFGTKIKKIRTNKKLTQQSVANELHVTRKSISNWENNRSIPNIEILRQLSNLYGCDLTGYSNNTNATNNNNAMINNNEYKITKHNFKLLYTNMLLYINIFSSIICILNIRYEVLPYIYTLIQIFIDAFIFYYFNDLILKVFKTKIRIYFPCIALFIIILISQFSKNYSYNRNLISLLLSSTLHSVVVTYGLITSIMFKDLKK